MGKVIMTTGNYSKTGYLLKNTKLNIHSIEELCYFMMKNPELCEDYLYDEGLAVYIKEQLGLKERGSLLADLIQRDAPLKDSLALFEEGTKLVGTCSDMLEKARQKVVKLQKSDAGTPDELPFDEEA